MNLSSVIVFLVLCFVLSNETYAQMTRRPQHIRDEIENDDYDEDITSDNLQYYSKTRGKSEQDRALLVTAEGEFNGFYGHSTTPMKSRSDLNRPVAKSTSSEVRTKDVSKETVQTIRNYSKVNDDGSFTFGYEAADGSFKEETRGTDCVVRGKYGYIDPDGNKREFTYVSGNPCDPNNPDQNDEEPERESDKNEPENVPVNFPRKNLRPNTQRLQTTTHSPTTVFHNQYTSKTYGQGYENEHENHLSLPLKPKAPPLHDAFPEDVTIKPRIKINPSPDQLHHITNKNNFGGASETNPPATTYRPTIQFFTQKSTPINYSKPLDSIDNKPTFIAITRKPVDFAAEFQKLQQTIISTTTDLPKTQNPKTYRTQNTIQKIESPNAASNPIYETQVLFDPTTGRIDSSIFPQNVAYGIPSTYITSQQTPYHSSPQIVTLEQFQHSNQPVYQRELQASKPRVLLQLPHFSQQVYHRDQENSQVLNSQQLYAQQQQIQLHQLQNDRLEASKRQSEIQNQSNNRFQMMTQAQLKQLQYPGFLYQPSTVDTFLS